VLIASLRGHRRDAVWLVAWSCVQALPSVASGWVVAEATQAYLAGRTIDGIYWLGLLGLAAIAGALGTRQSYLRLGALVEPLRDDLVELIVAGALARSTQPGRPPDTGAIGRMTHQAEIVRDCYAGVLAVACMFVCTIGSSLAGLITMVPATLPYVVAPLIATLLVLRLMLRQFAVRQRRSVTGEETVASSAAKAVSGLRDVTACGAEDQVLAELTASIERQADAARSAARISAARLVLITAGGWLPLVLVLAVAPSLLRGGVSPAHLIGAIAYIAGSLRSSLFTFSQGIGAGMVRLTVTLDRIVEASTVPPGQPLETAAAEDSLSLKDVAFAYDQYAEPVLRDLTLDIPPGDHLAIVGPSGVGKSSLAGLLAGLLRPTAGQILLPPREQRVLIPQEAYVFAGTLGENIRYLRDRLSTAELEAGAEAVGLAPLVARLGGYQAMVTPAALSAGERQLIALTRAYLSAAPIVILDEATCHLDPAAEARAEAAFASRPGTLIVIAHRISSAMRARRVLVLDGSTARCGDHAWLLESSPMYRDLVGYWSAR
jgi:ABC-type multidrug transport system fused ATPase/permease subunit